MKVNLVELRSAGRILKRSELPEPMTGELVIDDWKPEDKTRWKRRARLLGEPWGSTPCQLLSPLFDPQIMRIDESGMYIQGVQRESVNDGQTIAEYVQVWLCVSA